MLIDWLPSSCKRQKIFISYPSDHRAVAEDLAQTLKNDGHDVFFDKDSLPAAGDYNERIRRAIKSADRCIVLMTKDALSPGKYTLTELDFIKERWPAPANRVFPIMLDGSLPPESLPSYLRSVQAFSIKGNATAEIAAMIEKSRSISGFCTSCLVISAMVLGAGALAAAWLQMHGGRQVADVKLLPIESVHFRSRAKPPENPAAKGASTGWTASPNTLTMMSIAYQNRNDQGAPARLTHEDAELTFGQTKTKYNWTYVVNILSEKPCEDWLCRVANVGVENLEPGKTTQSRETMFLAADSDQITWKSFIDQVLAPDGPNSATVILRSAIDTSHDGLRSEAVQQFKCNIDVAAARANFLKRGFKAGGDPRPVFWQPPCSKS